MRTGETNMRNPERRPCQGFTLIELMVTLAIATILMMIAAPDMRGFIVSNRLSSNSNEILGALGLARTEAVRRNQRVIFCHVAATNGTPDITACTDPGTASWQGWMIFVDIQPADGARAVAEEVIRAGAFPGGSTQVLASAGLQGAGGRIVFRPDGLAKAHGAANVMQQVALGMCDESSSLKQNTRVISLAFGSRLSVDRAESSSCHAPADPS